MTSAARQQERLVDRFQQALPLAAHGKPALVTFLRNRLSIERISPRLTVTNVFYAGEQKGLLCQFVVSDAKETPQVFFAPIEQLAFDRQHPIARDVAVYRRQLTERTAFPYQAGNGR